jgi:hypothetical protein
MTWATRAVAGLFVLVVLFVGAFGIAMVAIGPAPAPPDTTMTGSRPAADNWHSHTSLLEGIPVAVALGSDFVRAWVGLAGVSWLAATEGVAAVAWLGLTGTLVLRRARRRRSAAVAIPV